MKKREKPVQKRVLARVLAEEMELNGAVICGGRGGTSTLEDTPPFTGQDLTCSGSDGDALPV